MATRTRLYQNGTLVLEDFPASDVSEHLADPTSVVWLDLYRPGSAELVMVGEEFDIHELALENAAQHGQRPRLDRFRSHDVLTAYAVTIGGDGAELSTSEIAVFLTGRAMITVRKDDGFDIGAVVTRWDESPGLARHGVAFLLHGLLADIVDGHSAAAQQLDDSIEALEDLLFSSDRREIETVQRRAFALRKSLVRLRQIVLPMREVVNAVMRPGLHVNIEPLVAYYQDVFDHALRVTEWTESLREMMASVMETNLSVQANRMNLIMKKVTSWAAIIAVPTAITGYFGQNLPYPGFDHESGFIVSTTLIVALSASLYMIFRRRDWL
ncbi:magnesium transporter CorA family protein [Streptomyces sp. AM8-1-1]|uniref:magnesium transporter CorA family protein n=1 Tax=Streptomyces sp. AM8-1-1 TaxID=3075825 RepID=UPI0028C401F4|nr:magnesium transporter CorA family protein [Streptomyces sp. AM8-1-1]WNO71305.1 magnesium transporter CorA family protein [Streptomyces sp. AM8-1-1]